MPRPAPYLSRTALRAVVAFTVLRGAFQVVKGVAQRDASPDAPLPVLLALTALTVVVVEVWAWRARERWLALALGIPAGWRVALAVGAAAVVEPAARVLFR